MNTTHSGIIMLLRSGMTGEKLTLSAEFDLTEGFEILRKQGVVAPAYQGAIHCGVAKDHPVMQKMLMISYQILMKHELQMKAVTKLFEAFEANEISFMPLKGCNIKKLYPRPELRAMGDADILIHVEDHDRIRPLIEPLGFAFHSENDHVFEWKSKELFVELHKSLVPPTDEDYYTYYGSGWQLAKKGNGFRHDMSVEDAYIFMFTHFARHYRGGGIGCRHVVDLFVYRRAYPEMDVEYIHQELHKLHLVEFHENILRMLDVWFLGAEGDGATELITAFVFSGGNWGTMEAEMFSAQVKKAQKSGRVANSRWKSILLAIFPARETLTYRYGILRKCPMLLPVVWVIRWFYILFVRRQNIRERIQILESIDDGKIIGYEQALRAVGLGFYFDS